jgi:hypothetical protein
VLKYSITTLQSNSALRQRLLRSRWLRSLFSFRFLAGAILFTAITGLFLREEERFDGLAWGLSEWGHVVVGWIAVPLCLGYLLHHVSTRWGSFRSIFRLLGVGLASALCVALLSGAFLDLVPGAMSWPGLRNIHYIATFPILLLLLLHPARIALRHTSHWIQSIRGAQGPGSDT